MPANTDPPIAFRRRLIGLTVETTRGTAAAVAAAVANTLVYDIKAKPGAIFAQGERLIDMIQTGGLPRVKGMQTGTLTFTTDVTPGDATMDLLQACACVVTTDVAVLSTDMSAHKTITFFVWKGGRVERIYGASGKVTFTSAGAAQRLRANWEFEGIYDVQADAAIPAFTPITDTGYRAAGMTVEIGGVPIAQIDGITLNLNTTVAARQDVEKASGLTYMHAIAGVPTLSIAPEMRTETQYAQLAKFIAGTDEVLEIVFSTGSYALTIDCPAAQRTTVDDAERDGKATDPLEIELHTDGTDACLTITEAAVS